MSGTQIRAFGRWRSNAFLRYIRAPSISSNLPLGTVCLQFIMWCSLFWAGAEWFCTAVFERASNNFFISLEKTQMQRRGFSAGDNFWSWCVMISYVVLLFRLARWHWTLEQGPIVSVLSLSILRCFCSLISRLFSHWGTMWAGATWLPLSVQGALPWLWVGRPLFVSRTGLWRVCPHLCWK